MAYGLKYTSTFRQIKSYSTTGEWQIKIYLEGYIGSSSEFKTEPGSIILRRDGDIKSTMLSTTFSFDIWNETEGEYREFQSASWGDYKIELIKDPNGTPLTYFIGYNQTEIFNESFETVPYSIELKWTCGLSHLKYIRWDNSGTLYNGQKALIEILRLATNKLPIGLGIREFVNVYENSINATIIDSMFNQIYLDSTLFKIMTKKEGNATEESAFMAYRVIEEILKVFHCHIYQWGGMWYIIRKQEYIDATMYYRNFNANVGTESTLTIASTGNLTTNKKTVNNSNTSTGLIYPVGGSREVFPPLNRMQVNYKQQNLDFQSNNLLRNGDFNDVTLGAGVTTHNGLPTYYTEGSGLDTTTYFAMVAVYKLPGKMFFQFKPSSYLAANAIDTTKYLQYTKSDVPVGTADSIQISFSVFLWIENTTLSGGSVSTWNSFISTDVNFTFEMQVKFGSYYLGGDTTSGYSWSTTIGRCKLEINGLGGGVTATNWFEEMFYVSQLMPALPETGLRDMSIKIYQPYHDVVVWGNNDPDNIPSVEGIFLTDYEILYLPSGAEPVEEQTIYADINEDENYEQIDVIIGDSINTVSQGALRLSSALSTDSWARRATIEGFPILRILIESISDDRGGFGELLNGRLIGEIEAINSIEMTVGATTSKYHIQTYVLKLESNTWEVSLFKLQNFSPTIAIKDSLTTTPAPKPTSLDPPVPINQSSRTMVSPTTVIGKTSTTSGNTTNLANYN